jgi:hypothetical protein
MPITFVSGDPFLTHAHVLAFGYNAAGRTETGVLEMALLDHYPAAFASYGKDCRARRIKTGTLWLWRESKPALCFMIVRETAVGTTRLRYIEAVAMTLARDFKQHSIRSMALVVPGSKQEYPTLKEIIVHWLGKSSLPLVVYEDYLPGVQAEEDFGGDS